MPNFIRGIEGVKLLNFIRGIEGVKLLNFIRGIVRPIVTLAMVATVIVLAIKLVYNFGDASMAKDVLVFVLASGTTIVGFLFGERSQKGNNNQPPTIPTK